MAPGNGTLFEKNEGPRSESAPHTQKALCSGLHRRPCLPKWGGVLGKIPCGVPPQAPQKCYLNLGNIPLTTGQLSPPLMLLYKSQLKRCFQRTFFLGCKPSFYL